MSVVDTVSDLIRDIERRLDTAEIAPERKTSGTVVSVADGIARVSGLSGVAFSEIVEFECGARGVALNLEEYTVGVVVLSGFLDISEGMIATGTGTMLEIPV